MVNRTMMITSREYTITYRARCACGYQDALWQSRGKQTETLGEAIASQRTYTTIIECARCDNTHNQR